MVELLHRHGAGAPRKRSRHDIEGLTCNSINNTAQTCKYSLSTLNVIAFNRKNSLKEFKLKYLSSLQRKTQRSFKLNAQNISLKRAQGQGQLT